MITRKSLLVVAAALLFVVGLSACAPGSPMSAPDVEINMDDAIAGQSAVLNGLNSGNMSLTDGQASSLITELMKANGLNKLEITDITADEDGGIHISLGTPIAGVDSVMLSGTATSSDGVVSLDLSGAQAGNMGVAPSMLDLIESQINAQLGGMAMGLPDGTYMVTPEMASQLNGMMQQLGLNSAEVSAVKTSFDGGNVHIVAEMAAPVMGVDSLGLSGAVMSEDGQLSVDISEAAAGSFVADPGILGLVGQQINGALSGMMLPFDVSAEGGELMVGMGQ